MREWYGNKGVKKKEIQLYYKHSKSRMAIEGRYDWTKYEI